MTVKERIFTISLLNSLDSHPEYADSILEDEEGVLE